MKLRTELTARILDNPDIEERKSKYSGELAYFFGSKEIAHFHSNNVIDLRMTKPLVKKLAGKGAKVSDWFEVTFRKESDLAKVIELLEEAIRANRASR